MKLAIEQGGDNDKRRGFALFIEESIGVLSPFKQYESAHFRISLDEKQDGILADYIIDALERTYERMARKYGFQPERRSGLRSFLIPGLFIMPRPCQPGTLK